MFEKLIIKDFQSHKHTEIQFSPGVNTIIGTSDHGKSSVFRALNLICKNKPEGSHFVSHWLENEKGKLKGNTECTLHVDGNVIERIKGKTNEYILNGESLKAFQRDVPEDIVNILNLDEANIQHQSDNFFLLNLPSTKVAEELNKIVNLEIIDESVNVVNQKLRESKNQYKTKQELIKSYKTKLENFDNLDICTQQAEQLTVLQHEIQYINSKINTLSMTIKELQNIENTISKYNQILQIEEKVNTFNDSFSQITTLDDKAHKLTKLTHQITTTFRHLAKCRCLVMEQKKVDLLFNLKNEIDDLEYVKQLKSTVTDINETNKKIKHYDAKISLLDTEYQNLLPDICPICDRPIDHEIHINCG